jgi:hypothetical protein
VNIRGRIIVFRDFGLQIWNCCKGVRQFFEKPKHEGHTPALAGGAREVHQGRILDDFAPFSPS